MMRLNAIFATAAAAVLCAGTANANSFVNGDFETGTMAGWTTNTAYRNPVNNAGLTKAYIDANSGLTPDHSAVVGAGLVAETGNQLNQVYNGNYAFRVEDTTFGGYASYVSQQVLNYTDNDIFFAWAAVLEGAHGTTDAATVKIFLHDDTDNVMLINREYNAAVGGSGVDPRFQYYAPTNHYWTPWQTEHIDVQGLGAFGHDITLTIIASDCQPTGHEGFLFLDGFGAVAPVEGQVPEPASMMLLGTGLAGLYARRRAKAKKA